LPPSIRIVEGLDALRNIIPHLDNSFSYAVEVRHRSWFQDLAYNFLSNNNMCLVWSQLAGNGFGGNMKGMGDLKT
jgi:uncharacterized protein YecE (DUF72 family)